MLPGGTNGLAKTSRAARNAQRAAQRAVAGGGKRRNVTLGTLKRLMARIVPSLLSRLRALDHDAFIPSSFPRSGNGACSDFFPEVLGLHYYPLKCREASRHFKEL